MSRSREKCINYSDIPRRDPILLCRCYSHPCRHMEEVVEVESAVPREGFDLSVIILASLLVYPMLGCGHSLLRLSNISSFYKVECTFSNISTCEHLPVVDIT